jgi:GT2 family glycosyltransferase
MMLPSIRAVIVTYHCGDRLDTIVAALLPQVAGVVVVDNGSDAGTVAALEALSARHGAAITLIRNGDNRGLGAAQNQGIRAALGQGAQWVLLLDDDSIPEATMVATLHAAAQAYRGDRPLGMVAPRYVEQGVDVRSRYVAPRGRFWFVRRQLTAGMLADDAVTVIASGSMISRELFAAIGLMAEGFFIDYVDHDFCLRARAAGYRIRLVGDAVLRHRQGNKTKRTIAGITLVTANYSPLRRYHIFRNRLFVLRRHARHTPFLLPYALMTYGFDMLRIVLLEEQRLAKLGAAVRGIAHGLTRPIPEAPRA